MISAIDRNIESLTRFQIGDAIQTDAAINPGNSGARCSTPADRVLGINAQIKSQSGGGEGSARDSRGRRAAARCASCAAAAGLEYGYLGVSDARSSGRSWPSSSTWMCATAR